MEFVMKPFISIYHVVSSIISFPTKLLKKTKDNVETNVEENKLNNDINKARISSSEQQKEEQEKAFANLKGIGNQKLKKKKPAKQLVSFRYTVTNAMGKKQTGIFEAEDIEDVRAFLISQDYKIVSVDVKKPYDIEIGGNGKMKTGDLSFALTQLSTYVKAGIPLVDAVRILAKQTKNPNTRKAFERLVYDLLKGENLSDAMLNQKEKFPKLLINMIKTAEMTGDLPSILDDMADYYDTMEKTRKQMISAMTYPAVVIVLAIGVLIFMLMYLVPQFVDMFESQDATLPGITLFIMGASDFMKANYIWIALALVAAFGVYSYLFKNVKSFRAVMQKIFMHIPVFGNIIIYNEVANFTKTFASLINHGVYITDSMEILSKITNNEVYKGIINKTLINLSKGNTISESFKGEWAFPVVAYEMLVTGENTGQLGLMMEKVADHFQSLHKTMIEQMKSLIEPIMIVALAGIVGVILLSIIVPMFDIYGQIK